MTRDTAVALMDIYDRVGQLFNEATAVIAREANPDEQKKLRRPLGQLMISLYADVQRPIIKEFPELDPDRQNKG